jgi:hypothetical protein
MPHIHFIASLPSVLQMKPFSQFDGRFYQEGKNQSEVDRSFMFLQWTLIPIPIYLAITRCVSEPDWIDSITSSLGNSSSAFSAGCLSAMVEWSIQQWVFMISPSAKQHGKMMTLFKKSKRKWKRRKR